jgi:hypothetical protein
LLGRVLRIILDPIACSKRRERERKSGARRERETKREREREIERERERERHRVRERKRERKLSAYKKSSKMTRNADFFKSVRTPRIF